MITNLLTYLDSTAMRLPDKAAFFDDTQSLSFRQLQSLSFSIGSGLYKRGCCKKPVAILMERSPRQIAAFMGVMRCGGFYVPLDRDMPKDRLLHILKTAQVQLLVCEASTKELSCSLLQQEQLLLYEDLIQLSPLLLPDFHPCDTDPAYIVFTSGSTGLPKGVCACHRSVIEYGEHMLKAVGMEEDCILGCQSPLYFDACLKEMLSALILGASVYLIPQSCFVQPVKLIESLNKHKVNTLCWVASAFSLVSALGTFKAITPQYLTKICFGSEVFPPKQLKRWQQACPNARFYNLYGPTECTGMSCVYPLTGEEGDCIPIGRPFPNTKLFLLDEEGKEAEEGEIYIGGSCVCLGYYNDPERTKAAFVQNPLQNAYPETVYKTGDLARYDEKGELVFLGRSDQQIKHMGHRIELGEIEAAANKLPGMEQSVCLYNKKSQRILLIYTGQSHQEAIRAGLSKQLPGYMLPHSYVSLESMPTTPNGKVDRKLLKQQYAQEDGSYAIQ